jgi:hypothetical protein
MVITGADLGNGESSGFVEDIEDNAVAFIT